MTGNVKAEDKFTILVKKKFGIKNLFLKVFCKNYEPLTPVERIVRREILGYDYLTKIIEFDSKEEALNYAKDNNIKYHEIRGILLFRSPTRQGKGVIHGS